MGLGYGGRHRGGKEVAGRVEGKAGAVWGVRFALAA